MEEGCLSLADQLAACQRRIRELEQTSADQQAVIAQQQEAIAAYQEQLAKAAEQLRFFKRAMFGQRRERYAPSPDQMLLFVPEAVEGLDAKQENTEDANADSPPPRTRRKPRRPRIEFPQFWEQRVLASIVINADETEVKMLKPGNGKAITGYLSGYAGDADHRYVFYDFRPSRSRDGPKEMLADYHGYLQTDGYIVYTSLVREAAGRLVDVACWAHGRRGFEEAIPATSHPLVHEAMIWTQQLYDLEDRAKEMSPDDRRALRQAEASPILARMKARFDEVRPTLRPTAKLAEAIDYVLNRWDAFVRYTEDGRIPIDNNVIERLLRPVAIGRKNFLFFGSENGGKTAATLYTLVQSARRNCVDVWPYLTDVLRRIAAIAPGDTAGLEALLPDRWLAAHPEHRLEQREEESREAQARRRRKRAARRLAVAQ